ncbi:lipid-transfer protein [Nocardia asteroides NBRC 15531]|uniref:propanoyl-CoA C-acyltransferase n=1 Tax=Nocardia asteroides NBRC 15531 TaxID=1110697 RepID=U5EFR6_NOCAS|nr:lipid-transfer protein [Nocardia asteroides]TLF66865.1 lipid-transfer protein [Nocardia asteroides NBRC 15531]UGT51888.1 lipid-transfer protein [Nocardia asteroides]SFN03130.1 Acetyl-CoA acetyltransferase [Nocardia asteroides]VEG35198.1 Beta-ketoadipyl-CoA thiolase [Nocardia asteroides]GAD85253.1 putative acetyl-CoA acyltransferase [Nocardia asteroides NBRC 15531]
MTQRVFVVGVGMTKFEKPGEREWDYPDMAREAGTAALADAGVGYDLIQQAYVGYVYGESTSGQRAVYELGLTGIPVVNVNNNCSTGSTALYLAAQAIRGGLADCTLALGFEKMQKGSLGSTFDDREQPMMRHLLALAELQEFAMPPAPYMFGAAGKEHMERYGTTAEQFAKIGVKNHRHSVNNPYAQFQKEYSLEEVLAAKQIYGPLTKLQCSPTSDGSGAVILASEDFVDRHGLADRAVEMVGQAMVTDLQSTFSTQSAINLVGADMTRTAARQVYDQAGIGPDDIDVIELHDCFSTNELLTYEALGLCAPGEGGRLVDDNATTYGGTWVVNPSGGLISKGHPLGATGLAQCSELTWQLRGTADARQVDGARIALQHNIGLGGAVVVTAYRPANR